MSAPDLARAIGGGVLAVVFIAFAVSAIIWNEMRERRKARRNVEAQCDGLRAADVKRVDRFA